MRIALCTRHLQDMTSENIIGSLARELKRLGHTPKIYTASKSIPRSLAPRFPIRQIPFSDDRALAAGFRRALIADHPDWVHLRVGGIHRNPLAWGLREALSLHSFGASIQFDDFGNPDLPPPCAATASRLKRMLADGCKASAVSRAVRTRMAKWLPRAGRSVMVIGNGVDPDWAQSARPRRSNRPYILSVGRLANYKGMDRLIFSFAAISEKFPVNLIIAGPVADRGCCSGLIRKLRLQSRVTLSGMTDRRALAALTAGAELFAIASRWESFGMAALEAMAAGKTVVAPRIGGYPDFITDGLTGRLFDPGDPHAAEGAIADLLSKPRLARSLGDAARSAARRWSWPKIAREYLNYWKKN